MKSPLQVTLTLTEDEHDFFMKHASIKNKNFWQSMHEEIVKIFKDYQEPEENDVCSGSKNKIKKVIDIQPPYSKIIKCQARKMGIPPAALLYRVIFAKHVLEIMKDKTFTAEPLREQ
jgi:hypothetical protein